MPELRAESANRLRNAITLLLAIIPRVEALYSTWPFRVDVYRWSSIILARLIEFGHKYGDLNMGILELHVSLIHAYKLQGRGYPDIATSQMVLADCHGLLAEITSYLDLDTHLRGVEEVVLLSKDIRVQVDSIEMDLKNLVECEMVLVEIL